MANNDHECVLAALLDYLQSTLGNDFQTYTRREQFLLETASQPALFLRQIGSDYEFQGSVNQRVTIDAEIWLACASSSDPTVPSDSALNDLKQKVLDAFAPDAPFTGRFTIGGMAFWCRVEGHSDQYPGDIGSQSMCALPIKITLP